MSEWQPIETAPKNGTRFIAYRPGADGQFVDEIGEEYWSETEDLEWAGWSNSSLQFPPTYWIPLPKPPQ